MKKRPPFESLWADIEADFEWDRVYLCMKALNWHWSFGDGLSGIPTIDTLKLKAKRLLEEVYLQGKGSVATGGFYAAFDDNALSLSFLLSDCYASL